MPSTETHPFQLLLTRMVEGWACTCGHGRSRHCDGCGVCHVGQDGHKDPFYQWCGCLKPVPIWVRMALR